MLSALVGLVGVIVGLAVGRGYSFWATRRSEFASAVTALAVLGEDLRATLDGRAGSRDRLADTWRDQRVHLATIMSPRDFKALAGSMPSPAGLPGPFGLEEMTVRVEILHELCWQEHEAFILVPLLHYLSGDTVSKRIAQTLEHE